MSGEPKATVTEEPPVEGAPEQNQESVADEVRQESTEHGPPGAPDGSPDRVPAARGENAHGPQTGPGTVGSPSKSKTRGKSKTKGSAKEKAAEEDDRPLPIVGAYHVTLPAFEGPLDLLLHLIQQHELDIKDIPMSFVSQKYVEYIMLMQNLNIDLASEYLVMAATLAHIKSKMLLPKPPVDQDDDAIDDLDPRSELVRRLLEYQKYKNAAEQLGSAPVLGRDVFLRGAPAPMVDGPAPLAQVSVFKLFDAFQKLLSRAHQQADHLIDVDRISISERIIELTDLLRGKGRMKFIDLFDENMTRPDLIVSFLALLEMTRLRMMLVIQEGPLEPIEIELTLAEEHDEILARGMDGEDPLAALARGDVSAVIGKDDEQLSFENLDGVASPDKAPTPSPATSEAPDVSEPSDESLADEHADEANDASVDEGEAPSSSHDLPVDEPEAEPLTGESASSDAPNEPVAADKDAD
jgi:segregation and condensation protein A